MLILFELISRNQDNHVLRNSESHMRKKTRWWTTFNVYFIVINYLCSILYEMKTYCGIVLEAFTDCFSHLVISLKDWPKKKRLKTEYMQDICDHRFLHVRSSWTSACAPNTFLSIRGSKAIAQYDEVATFAQFEPNLDACHSGITQ